jgi:hypothetical protein
VAVGDLLADARCGLKMLQQRLVPSDTILSLPAPAVLNILMAAHKLRDTLTWSPSTLPLIERFCAFLAVGINNTFFCRAETGTRCLTSDLSIDRPSQQMWLFVRKSKGDQRRDTCDKLVLAVPTPANPVLADLLDYYHHQRTTFYIVYYKRPPPDAF